MTIAPLRGGRRACAAHFALILCLSTTAALGGCTTPSSRADHAYKAGRYDEALVLYEESIKEGSRDPELYFRAAQCATRTGNFTIAERYYSRSLRYGGGLKTARALAEFYISTSNYVRAIHVLRYLLNAEPDPQSVYNNLGTALMYSGEPLDAESYLLIAQQKRPDNPIPYVNLGVLYDRYLRQPAVAVGFYECYLKMAGGAGQARSIALRVQDLRDNVLRGSKPLPMECGKPYRPHAQPVPDPKRLRQLLADKDDPEAIKKAPAEVIDLKIDDPNARPEIKRAPKANPSAKPDPKATTSGPIIERGADPQDLPAPRTTPAGPTLDEHRAKARQAYATRDYKQAIDQLEFIPVKQLSSADAMVMGMSHYELKQWGQAETWLQRSMDQDPNPAVLSALLDLYTQQKRMTTRDALCDKWRGRDELLPALRACPASTKRSPSP